MTPRPGQQSLEKQHTDTAEGCIHPFELRHAYRLLSSLPLAKKSTNEIEQLTSQLASARSLYEINQLIRPLRQKND